MLEPPLDGNNNTTGGSTDDTHDRTTPGSRERRWRSLHRERCCIRCDSFRRVRQDEGTARPGPSRTARDTVPVVGRERLGRTEYGGLRRLHDKGWYSRSDSETENSGEDPIRHEGPNRRIARAARPGRLTNLPRS